MFESENSCNGRNLKRSIFLAWLIYCCHDNRHNVCGEDGLKDQTRGGRWVKDCEVEKNLCHYSVATGLWFTAAYSPYNSTGPWSQCRLNVEQYHDWDATSLHSPPLQQLWLTDQQTLFNPLKWAPRLMLETNVSLNVNVLLLMSSHKKDNSIYGTFLITGTVLYFLPTKCRNIFWTETRLWRIWQCSASTDKPAQWSNCLSCSCNELLLSIVICNCFQGYNYCRGGAQLHSLLAQLIMGSRLALESGRKTARSESHLVPQARKLGWHPVTTNFTTGWLL